MEEGIKSDHIRGAEAGALRVAHRLARDGVDVFGLKAHLDHRVHRVEHGVAADAVAHEVRRILAHDDALAELLLRAGDDAVEHFGGGRFTDDELEELHVPDGVKEVHHEEALLKRLAPTFEHILDAEARGIRRDDGRVGAGLFELVEEVSLDLQVLDDGFDHEVGIGEKRDMIFKVARRDARGVFLGEEERRLGLEGLLERAFGERGAVFRVVVAGGHDVEQDNVHACVCEVSRDATAHHACADYANLSDRFGHSFTSLEFFWRRRAALAFLERRKHRAK